MKLFQVRLWYSHLMTRWWRLGLAHFTSCTEAHNRFAPCVVYRAPKSFGGTAFSWVAHVHGEASPLSKTYKAEPGRERERVVQIHPFLLHDPKQWALELPPSPTDQLDLVAVPRSERSTPTGPRLFPLKNDYHPNPQWLDAEDVGALRVERDRLLETAEPLASQRAGFLSVDSGRLYVGTSSGRKAVRAAAVPMSTKWAECRREVPTKTQAARAAAARLLANLDAETEGATP